MHRTVNRYTDEEKIAIVNEYYLSGKSKEAISRKYYLRGHCTLSKWIAKFVGILKFTRYKTFFTIAIIKTQKKLATFVS